MKLSKDELSALDVIVRNRCVYLSKVSKGSFNMGQPFLIKTEEGKVVIKIKNKKGFLGLKDYLRTEAYKELKKAFQLLEKSKLNLSSEENLVVLKKEIFEKATHSHKRRSIVWLRNHMLLHVIKEVQKDRPAKSSLTHFEVKEKKGKVFIEYPNSTGGRCICCAIARDIMEVLEETGRALKKEEPLSVSKKHYQTLLAAKKWERVPLWTEYDKWSSEAFEEEWREYSWIITRDYSNKQ